MKGDIEEKQGKKTKRMRLNKKPSTKSMIRSTVEKVVAEKLAEIRREMVEKKDIDDIYKCNIYSDISSPCMPLPIDCLPMPSPHSFNDASPKLRNTMLSLAEHDQPMDIVSIKDGDDVINKNDAINKNAGRPKIDQYYTKKTPIPIVVDSCVDDDDHSTAFMRYFNAINSKSTNGEAYVPLTGEGDTSPSPDNATYSPSCNQQPTAYEPLSVETNVASSSADNVAYVPTCIEQVAAYTSPSVENNVASSSADRISYAATCAEQSTSYVPLSVENNVASSSSNRDAYAIASIGYDNTYVPLSVENNVTSSLTDRSTYKPSCSINNEVTNIPLSCENNVISTTVDNAPYVTSCSMHDASYAPLPAGITLTPADNGMFVTSSTTHDATYAPSAVNNEATYVTSSNNVAYVTSSKTDDTYAPSSTINRVANSMQSENVNFMNQILIPSSTFNSIDIASISQILSGQRIDGPTAVTINQLNMTEKEKYVSLFSKLNDWEGANQRKHILRCHCCLFMHDEFEEVSDEFKIFLKAAKDVDEYEKNPSHLRCYCCWLR